MDWRTFLDVVLALLAAWLGYRNLSMATKKENQRESQEMTEIRVQLTNVMGMLRDLQKDMKSVSVLSERVVKIETKLELAFQQLDEIKKELNNGKQ